MEVELAELAIIELILKVWSIMGQVAAITMAFKEN